MIKCISSAVILSIEVYCSVLLKIRMLLGVFVAYGSFY